MLCRHCQRVQVNRPRGLCWSCYYTPGLREHYPSTSKFARRGIGAGLDLVRRALAPTRAMPGSPEKVAILEERAQQHQELWHPQDAPMDWENCRLSMAGRPPKTEKSQPVAGSGLSA